MLDRKAFCLRIFYLNLAIFCLSTLAKSLTAICCHRGCYVFRVEIVFTVSLNRYCYFCVHSVIGISIVPGVFGRSRTFCCSYVVFFISVGRRLGLISFSSCSSFGHRFPITGRTHVPAWPHFLRVPAHPSVLRIKARGKSCITLPVACSCIAANPLRQDGISVSPSNHFQLGAMLRSVLCRLGVSGSSTCLALLNYNLRHKHKPCQFE